MVDSTGAWRSVVPSGFVPLLGVVETVAGGSYALRRAENMQQMTVFEHVRHADAACTELRQQLLDTWVAVTDAGGAVGFVPPADPAEIAPALDAALARVIDGRDELGVLRRDGAAVGMGFVAAHTSALRRHWRTVLRVMVDPELQGSGAGGQLLEGLHGIARSLGLEQLHLTVRGGTGVEGFYERFGYTVIGRHPGAVRVAPGDDRDELILVKRL